MIDKFGVKVPRVIRGGPESTAVASVVEHDLVLADLVAVPTDQMRMMLVLSKTTGPGYAAATSKLPQANVEGDIVFKHPNA